MENNLAKNYSPKEFEDRLYKAWEESGAFHAEIDKTKKPFTILMPPPNIKEKSTKKYRCRKSIKAKRERNRKT